MADISKNVEGLKELHQALQEFPVKFEKSVLRGGIRVGMKVIEDLAKQKVPVRYGALRRDIKVRVSVRKGVATAVLTAGAKTYYALMVEMGTAAHIIKVRKKNPKQLVVGGKFVSKVQHPGSSPSPYMRPALDEGSQPALAAFAAYVRARITKEKAKL